MLSPTHSRHYSLNAAHVTLIKKTSNGKVSISEFELEGFDEEEHRPLLMLDNTNYKT